MFLYSVVENFCYKLYLLLANIKMISGGQHNKGKLVFFIVSLTKSIPIVVRAAPEITISDEQYVPQFSNRV